ncbi:hypothetical protein HPB47_006924 [Ixodes persulcatus]|uniref:Uncharacterized protein n=1 Tax=Ixodes persulcatus TaxID=34615 RepID=A0AC60P957_IXOPE|nr:hypothetical protein HPB47_006924 [Ixodes persulcatus]
MGDRWPSGLAHTSSEHVERKLALQNPGILGSMDLLANMCCHLDTRIGSRLGFFGAPANQEGTKKGARRRGEGRQTSRQEAGHGGHRPRNALSISATMSPPGRQLGQERRSDPSVMHHARKQITVICEARRVRHAEDASRLLRGPLAPSDSFFSLPRRRIKHATGGSRSVADSE